MSPYSNLSMGTTTPLHIPDEDLAKFESFSQQQQNNVYLPKQMSYQPPPMMMPHMPQPQTPVSYNIINILCVKLYSKIAL